MERRQFLKLSLAISTSLMAARRGYSAPSDLSNVQLDLGQFNKSRQTIIVFLAGGASPLSANLSNLEEFNQSSQQDYFSHFGDSYLNKTSYDLWKEAGGDIMQRLLDNKDMSIIRTCYSPEREEAGNKAHGVCTQQNMRGNYDTNKAGLLTTLSRVMENNGLYDPLNMPFMALNGENSFYAGDPIKSLKPVTLNYALANPFDRKMTSANLYNSLEKENSEYEKALPEFDRIMDDLANSHNSVAMFKQFLKNREILANKVSQVASDRDDGGNDKYLAAHDYNTKDLFHRSLATAIELLDSSPTTRTLTMGTNGLGGWDDHSFCKVSYTQRMQNLFQALESGMKHLKAIGKENNISIIVYSEFGRNINLNKSFGWDHGNLQSIFFLGGKDYINHVGGSDAIIGETVVDNGGEPKSGRLWLKPKEGTYQCSPLSIASTIYAIHGIRNPETLTGGYGVINPTVKGQSLLKDGVA